MRKYILLIFFVIVSAQVWESSFSAGTFDNDNNFMGGSEVLQLVSHKNKLFASIRNGGVISDTENGAKSTLTAILGRMATYSGKKLTMEDALNSKLKLVPEEMTWNSTPPTLPDKKGKYKIPIPGKTKF